MPCVWCCYESRVPAEDEAGIVQFVPSFHGPELLAVDEWLREDVEFLPRGAKCGRRPSCTQMLKLAATPVMPKNTKLRGDRACSPDGRPPEFRIKVEKRPLLSGKVGLDVMRCGGVLKIQRVCEGVIGDWNANHPDLQVRCYDSIKEVNGVRGNADALLHALAMDAVLNVLIASHDPISL